jgi:PTS system mannose-specific IID component
MIATDAERRRVSRIILFRVFIRSLLIQVGFNTRLMQGLGFAYTLYPALKSLHKDRATRTEAVRRHLVLFNTHPYFAAAIIGAMVRIEERVASGLATPKEAIDVRNALAAPLAAIGDAFFWDAVRPACALLAALTAPTLGLWAIVVFLAFYNAIHLATRIWLFTIGYREAEGLVTPVGRARFPVGTRLIRRVAAALAGAVAAQVTIVASRDLPGAGRLAFVLATLAGVTALALVPRVNAFFLAYGALALALLASLLF